MADIDNEKKTDDKPEKPKTTKKLNTSDVKKNPVRKAKDTLNSLSDLPNVDIEDLINNLLKNTQDSVINSSDWKDVYRALSSDDKNSDINDVIKHISSLDFITSSSHMERLNKYKDFKMILSRVPVIKKILRLYTTNILAPDDISKMSVKMMPKNPTISKTTEEYISIENKFKVIIDRIDLEKRLYDLVFQTLFYGDMFVEILSSKRYLMQTLYNLQIPVNDKNIKLNESALDDYYSDEEIVDMAFEDGRSQTSYTVKMEWAKPIFQQISETIDFANMYYHSILNEIGINEHNFKKYRNNGFLQYVTETFFGDQKILSNPEEFKIFQEDFTTISNVLSNAGIQNGDRDSEGDTDRSVSKSYDADDKEELLNKKYALDYLPIQSTLSALNIKIHDPDKIIILRDEDIDYGYLYINGGIEGINSISNGAGNSQISVNSVDAQSVISTSNFINSSNGKNLGMYGSNGSNGSNQKLSHSKQITNRIAEYIKKKFEEYHGNVNIENMSTNLQMIIANILNSGSNTINIRYIPPLNMQQVTIRGTGTNSPYGESVTEDLLFRAKMLLADDTNSIINKYTSTGKRLVWVVASNTQQQAANRIQQLMKTVNNRAITTDNCLDLMSSAIFQNDSIYVSKVNGERQVELETVDLGSPDDSTNSNMYLIKQLLTGADIPPAHLG